MKTIFLQYGLAVFIAVVAIATAWVLWIGAHTQNHYTIKDQQPVATSTLTDNLTASSTSPSDTSPLGGYNVLISDRGNNRIIEVTPEKQLVWEYDFNLPKLGLGADDAFFTDNRTAIITNLENYNLIQQINIATKQVTWSYGVPGKAGSKPGYLNTPDDAYKLPNGDVTVADIKNCRVIEINSAKQIVRQYGITGHCGNASGLLDMPNGDTPVSGGNTLISNIVGRKLIELDPQWKQIFTMPLPASYPSDPQLMKNGDILISDYSKPGKIVEVSKQGQVVWSYQGQGQDTLNHPSLAIELPNGNILTNDDFNNRVIVIDKQTKQIVWQYGITGQAGKGPNELNIPDGLDIIPTAQGSISTTTVSTSSAATYSVGQVSRHPAGYIGQAVELTGYVLKTFSNYAIISDEATGQVGYYDLPITGTGTTALQVNQKYTFVGTLVSGGLNSVNKDPNHLELTELPQLTQ